MPRYFPLEELRLIDKNISSKPMIPYWCESCHRRLMYQKNAPPPQCPHCYGKKGLMVKMKCTVRQETNLVQELSSKHGLIIL